MTLDEFAALPRKRRLAQMKILYPRFIDKLKIAGTQIGEEYFKLLTDNNESTKEKELESIYCHELNYRLRALIESDNFLNFILHAQVDKGGHRYFKGHPRLHDVIPDFLFHTPGKMAGNFIVMEVKPLSKVFHPNNKTNKNVLRDDLEKLTSFRDKRIRYFSSIHLIYGEKSPQDILDYGKLCLELFNEAKYESQRTRKPLRIDLSLISVFLHRKPQSRIEYIPWHRILPLNNKKLMFSRN